MIYCDAPILEQWLAPPQEDFPRPTWTKLFAPGLMLSNSIEYADWTSDPVQPIVCELCWSAGCDMSGLAHLVTLENQVLWLRPNWSDLEAEEHGLSYPYEQHYLKQPVLFPKTVWDNLCEKFPRLPPAAHYPHATRLDLASLWLMEMPEPVRVNYLIGLDDYLQREALFAHPLELEESIQIIRSVIHWVQQNPAAPVHGQIVLVETINQPQNSIYFDGPPFPEWPVFIIGQECGLAFGQKWAFAQAA